MTLSKEEGGLGIRNLRTHNSTLLMKLTGKLLSSSPEPCFRLLRSQHIQDQILVKAKQNDTPVCKTICNSIEPVITSTKVSLGDGQSTQFWKDRWINAGRFYITYPAIASYATNINWTTALLPPSSYKTLGLSTSIHCYQAKVELSLLHWISPAATRDIR